MRAHVAVIAFALLGAGTQSAAIQPVDAGLQPLVTRQQAIVVEQLQLDSRLQAPATSPRQRYEAYRKYKVLEAERVALESELQWIRQWARSPLVKFATDDGDMRP